MREDTSPRRSNHTNPHVINESHLIEILPGQLYFGCFPFHDATIDKTSKTARNTHFIPIRDKFHYEPFYEDFGPWNLSVLYRLCVQIDKLLEIEEKRGRRTVIYCQEDGSGQYEKIRVNTAYILGAYLIIYQGFSADDAYLKVAGPSDCSKFIGFRDASMGAPQYLLHVHDVLRGIEKALKLGWLDFSDFDFEEYEYYERVENGDFNWIIPGKVLSFCGPHNESKEENGYPYHAPDVYFDYFREKGVSTIVRLNAKNYDAQKFVRAGFDHVDLFFVDGSTPSDEIMLKFIKVVDTAKGGVAVHCKAGLGRTGTLIACWMMKTYGLTAGECMGWMRVCRPGSVIGPQQNYLVEKQKMCWGLSSTNGVHLIPSKGEKRSVRKLVNGVDEICLGNTEAPAARSVRPNILRRKAHVASSTSALPSSSSSMGPGQVKLTSKVPTKPNGASSGPAGTHQKTRIVDETALDEQGRSQGDRLLALKAKQQHEHPTTPSSSSTSRRFTKATPQMIVPSQAYLNKNREPASPKLRTTPSGNVAYRTRNASGTGTLSRTGNESYRFHNSLFYEPASAVFPSMASRRSEATRYHSPTTPIKPMSPAYSPDSQFKMTLRSTDRPMQPHISKCTLATAESNTPRRILSMPSSSKSTSSLRKIQLSRPRPYPSTGVRVELCANGRSFDIRPREKTTLPGAALAANSEALLGKRKKI